MHGGEILQTDPYGDCVTHGLGLLSIEVLIGRRRCKTTLGHAPAGWMPSAGCRAREVVLAGGAPTHPVLARSHSVYRGDCETARESWPDTEAGVKQWRGVSSLSNRCVICSGSYVCTELFS